MADDVVGAVRRTPRPTPRGDDHQTPETAAQDRPGATNPATPVSPDAGTATGELSPEDPAGLAELRAKLTQAPTPDTFCVDGCPCGQTGETAAACALDTATDVEAYAALPECPACEGTGKDNHGTVFEAPLAVHFAAPPITIGGHKRQLCMWCGHVLIDSPHGDGPEWLTGDLVHVEDGVGSVWPYKPGDPLPAGCCALPDETPAPGPGCYPPVDGWDGTSIAADGPDEAQETRAAADRPAEPVDTHADEQEADRG